MHDAQLLEEYAARKSEAAFRALVERYTGLVHGVAWRGTGDVSLAEETAQAVFILLARKAPELVRQKELSLGGWLHRTTRFVAARAARNEQRRRQRDREAFAMQELHSSQDAWRAMSPLVDEGVDALAPKDRAAILQRYFLNKSWREVGECLGVSEDAARKRVNGSVEKLRRFFARRGFKLTATVAGAALKEHAAKGAPEGMATTLGARTLASVASAGHAPALVGDTLAAWRWETTKATVQIALAMAVVVVAAIMAWNRAETRNANQATGATSANGSQMTAARQSKTAAPSRSDATPATQSVFQIVDAETGEPIPYAGIHIYREPEGTPQSTDIFQGQWGTSISIHSLGQADYWTSNSADKRGQILVSAPLPAIDLMVIGAIVDGYEQQSYFWSAKDGLVFPAEHTIKMKRGAHIGGVILDNETGQPISGAGVWVLGQNIGQQTGDHRGIPLYVGTPPAAVTDANGRWSTGCAPSSGYFVLAVHHPDYLREMYEAADPGPEPDEPPANPQRTRATGIQSTSSIRITSIVETRSTQELTLPQLRADDAVMVLTKGFSLQGTVADQNGYAVSGAVIGNGEAPFQSVWDGSATSGADGSFTLRGLGRGSHRLLVHADGFAPQYIDVEDDAEASPLTIALQPSDEMRFHIVDESGVPLAGAVVTYPDLLESQIKTPEWRGLRWRAQTDANGNATWLSPPPGSFSIDIVKNNYRSHYEDVDAGHGPTHQITLRPNVTFFGTVSDGATGEPISDFTVFPCGGDNIHAIGLGVCETNGVYHADFTRDGAMWIKFRADGYAPLSVGPLDASSAQKPLNVSLTTEIPVPPRTDEEVLADLRRRRLEN